MASAGVKQEANKGEALSVLPAHLPDLEFKEQAGDEYTEEHRKLRTERQARRDELRQYRERIKELPITKTNDFGGLYYEIPGRPQVVYSIRDYSHPDMQQGRSLARQEVPFLFKAFEAGQQPPPRPGTKKADQPRAATIHEYLDWTVTASEAEDPDELDFAGFRVIVLSPRAKLLWPPPENPYNIEPKEEKRVFGPPKPAVPTIMVHHKPITAATIRIGPSWIEVPFYATQESRRNKGYGRALLEAIEEVARFLKINLILLCSTDDARVKGTWQRLGFSFTTKEDLAKFGVTSHDLIHMDNTVQMHKDVSSITPWKSVMVKQGSLMQRLYYLPGSSNRYPKYESNGYGNGIKHAGVAKKPAPAKKKAKSASRLR